MRTRHYLPWDPEGEDVETLLALSVLCNAVTKYSSKSYGVVKESLYRLIGWLCRG